MQVNSVNNQNFGKVIIPQVVKGKIESDIIKSLNFNTERMAELSSVISGLERNTKLNVHVIPKRGAFMANAEGDFDVYIENAAAGTQTVVDKGATLAERFMNALHQAAKI